MALAAILMEQTVVMCLFLLLGYLMGKLGWVTQKGSGEITNLLVRIVVPAAIINSFFVERTPERLLQFGVSAVLICAAALLSMVLSQIIFRRHPVENFGVAFSNVGFIGIPLITAVLGEKAVFYIAFYSVLVGVLQWTWGVYTITGDKQHVSPRKILTNPATIAMGLALLVFIPGWGARLPVVLTRPVSMMAAVNTPLAMVVMGCYLAGADLRSVFSDRFNWWASFVRLVLISAATAALFCLVPPRLCRGAHRGVHCGHHPHWGEHCHPGAPVRKRQRQGGGHGLPFHHFIGLHHAAHDVAGRLAVGLVSRADKQ